MRIWTHPKAPTGKRHNFPTQSRINEILHSGMSFINCKQVLLLSNRQMLMCTVHYWAGQLGLLGMLCSAKGWWGRCLPCGTMTWYPALFVGGGGEGAGEEVGGGGLKSVFVVRGFCTGGLQEGLLGWDGENIATVITNLANWLFFDQSRIGLHWKKKHMFLVKVYISLINQRVYRHSVCLNMDKLITKYLHCCQG